MANTADEQKLELLHSKKEAIFQRMNDLFTLSKTISSSTSYESRTNENFMAESETIENWQMKYEQIIDEMNIINLKINPDFKVSHKSLFAFEDLYSRVKRIRNKINSLSADVSKQTATESNNKCAIKLPPIEIPSFDGKMENWSQFYESFKANIHDNNQLTDSQRVQYLMGKLTHSAQITSGIVPTSKTYKILWNSLVNKYQDKRALGTHYLNNILELKMCQNTANSLNLFIEKYSASIAAIKQLEIADPFDFILLHCALKKVDTKQYKILKCQSVRKKFRRLKTLLLSFRIK